MKGGPERQSDARHRAAQSPPPSSGAQDVGVIVKRRAAAVLVLSMLGAGAFTATLQVQKSIRFEIGSMDRDYLADPEHAPIVLRMDGPIRHPDNSVEVIDFYGRLTGRRAQFSLPYHARHSPVRIRLRCHRFGLDATVAMTVNGHSIEDFVFTDRSYPWGGIHAVIPQEVAERGPLQVELEVRNAEPPRGRFPEDFGVGIDWIEVEPLSEGVFLVPSVKPLGFALVFPLLAFFFIRLTGGSFLASLGVHALATASVSLFTALAPQVSGMAWSRLWVLFPIGYLLHLVLKRLFTQRLEPRLGGADVAFLSRLFVAASLAHSVLIFFPNHAPPDLWNHLPQVEWLESLELSYENIYRYSTSSDVSDDGHVRPHFGAAYGAPYPPHFYVLTFAISRLHDDPRFLVEFLSVLMGALMLVLIFLLAKTIWRESLIAQLAAILLATEISLWHHAHRVHAPGILGELFVMLWILFLATRYRTLLSGRGVATFAVLTAVTVLSYAAPLVQTSIMAGFLTLLLAGSRDEGHTALSGRFALSFALGLAAAFGVYYWPYALEAVAKSRVILDRGAYEAPATFFFLRNQMRDTVRILMNGYPLYVTLSVVGWLLLIGNGVAAFHKRLLYAAGLSYVVMLILKDPVFFPWIFLHAKEDLYYAPIACLLSGLALARLWKTSSVGRMVAVVVLVLAAGLVVRDQYLNANTLDDQQVDTEFFRNMGG